MKFELQVTDKVWIYIGGSSNHPRHNWCCSGIDYSITNEQISSNDRRNQVEKVLFYNESSNKII